MFLRHRQSAGLPRLPEQPQLWEEPPRDDLLEGRRAERRVDRLAQRGLFERLAPVHVAAGEDPLPVARLDRAPTCTDLGFALGPRINAGGRVGKSDLGVRLLTTEDADEAEPVRPARARTKK